MTSLYAVLGVAPSASKEEIRKAYRKKARELHPDLGGDNAKMVELVRANSVLSDDEKRKHYDVTGDEGEVDNETTEILQTFFSIAEQALLERGDNPIAECLKEYNQDVVNQYKRIKSECDGKRRKIQRAIYRIAKRPERDYLGSFLEEKLREVTKREEVNEKMKRINDAAVAMFKDYAFHF